AAPDSKSANADTVVAKSGVSSTENKPDAIGASKSQDVKAEFVYYKVCKGDNFWSIAKKFPGVTNNEIMKLNNMTKATSLKVGQILKILPKA
ncbi:MAG TPA: LysM domain-containing protein, partial [Prolixibacteraceae bacterium]|nr:LysM domain-containing protein [Prolixibacteraceae bacterium]